MMIQILTRALLIANTVVFISFGPGFVIWPDYFAEILGIHLSGATAYADFRAMYGGLPFGVGVFFLASLYRSPWVVPSLFIIGATSLCLMLSRVYSLVAGHTDVAGFIYIFMMMEFTSFALAAFL